MELFSFCDRDYSATELLSDPMLDFPLIAEVSGVPFGSVQQIVQDSQIVRIDRSITQIRVLGELVGDNDTGEPVQVSVPLDGEQNFEYKQGNQREVPIPVRSGRNHRGQAGQRIRLRQTFSQTYLVINIMTEGHICLSPGLVSVHEKNVRFRPVKSIENEVERHWDNYQRYITSLINRYGGDNSQITGNNEIEYFHHSTSDLKEEQIPRVAQYVSLCSMSSVPRDCHMYDSLTAPSIPARRTKSCIIPERNHEYHSIDEVQSLRLDNTHTN